MERGSKTILASHPTLQFKRKKYLSHLPNAIPFQWWMIPTNQIVSNNIQLCKKRLRQSHCVNNIWSRVWGQTEINHVHHPWKMKGSCIKEKSQLGLTSEKCWYPACSNIAVQLSESFHTNPAKNCPFNFLCPMSCFNDFFDVQHSETFQQLTKCSEIAFAQGDLRT